MSLDRHVYKVTITEHEGHHTPAYLYGVTQLLWCACSVQETVQQCNSLSWLFSVPCRCSLFTFKFTEVKNSLPRLH